MVAGQPARGFDDGSHGDSGMTEPDAAQPAGEDQVAASAAEGPRVIPFPVRPAFGFGPEPLSSLPPIVRAMRPLQWTKNLLVFAALIFTRNVFNLEPLLQSIGAFISFCAISSAVYLINDVRDIEADSHHPEKCLRPIASGQVSPRTAVMTAIGLVIGSLTLGFIIRPEFAGIVAAYFVLMVAYTFALKKVAFVDVIAIAAGFVLRAAAGAVAIDVPISPWLYLCTMMLALLLGFGKRRHELVSLEGSAGKHRANLDVYSLTLLDQVIAGVAGGAVIAYAVYTVDAPSLPRNHAMLLTVPFVLYAIIRYLYLVYRRQKGGSPEVLLVTDKPLILAIMGWGLASMLILYFA